jgi:hypothetical protein
MSTSKIKITQKNRNKRNPLTLTSTFYAQTRYTRGAGARTVAQKACPQNFLRMGLRSAQGSNNAGINTDLEIAFRKDIIGMCSTIEVSIESMARQRTELMTADSTDEILADEDEALGVPDGPPTPSVKMTVTLPRSVAAFLRWKAETEGLRRDELLRRIITHYAKKLRERDLKTPPIINE